MPSLVPKKITIPSTVEEAATALGGLEALLTAKEWQRAAIVAAFVKIGEGRGKSIGNSSSAISPVRFAKLKINGLQSENTVRMYVQRWLDAHDGVHPEPGAQVLLPETPWPVTRTGTDGYDSEEGAVETIKKLTRKHPTAITKAAEESDEVAEATADAVEQSSPVRTKVVKRATKRNAEHKAKIKEKIKPLQETADKIKEEYEQTDTGYADPTLQTLIRLIRGVHEAEVVWALAGGNRDADLIGALSELQSAIDDWRKRVTGTGTVEISENDRVWADELGIDLGVI
jgi:hypothetical protein